MLVYVSVSRNAVYSGPYALEHNEVCTNEFTSSVDTAFFLVTRVTERLSSSFSLYIQQTVSNSYDNTALEYHCSRNIRRCKHIYKFWFQKDLKCFESEEQGLITNRALFLNDATLLKKRDIARKINSQ